MIPIDFSGKVALVTGVGDNESFAWFIAKALKAAGAKVVLASHPRVVGIVESFLSRDMDAESRKLPYVGGELKVEKVYALDARFDTMADVDEATRNDKRWNKYPFYAVKEVVDAVGKEFGGIDMLIHSIAFAKEIKSRQLETSRAGYFEAIGISAYSLTSLLRAAEPYMENRPGGASAVGLTYLGGSRVVPYYGGGMTTAKAALQIDAAQLAHNLGKKNIRVNLISAGPYASRAARGIRPDFNESIEYAAKRSPLPRGIEPDEVANATVFLCSPLASAISGHTLFVDCGYNVMGVELVIDAHIHVVPPNLPGVGPLSPGLRASAENVARVVREQMTAAGVTHAAAMGAWQAGPDDPLGVNRTLLIAEGVKGLYAIGVMDPTRSDAEHLRRAEAQIRAGRIIALKAYLGYVHHFPNDSGYLPYYELAAQYKLPVFFHTGDTYSPFAKLKYAQPLAVDEVAVDFPKVNFVLCHVGNPWTVEAAEVVYKNMNVWTDLSGLVVGEDGDLTDAAGADGRQDVLNRIGLAFRYAERPNRFVYGSDWPLAPMTGYAAFIREAIPEEFHEMVFDENARKLFGERLRG